MKRTMALFLCLVLLFSCIPMTPFAAASETSGSITYSIFDTDMAVLLPGDSSVNNSGDDEIVYECPSLGIFVAFVRYEYMSLSDWMVMAEEAGASYEYFVTNGGVPTIGRAESYDDGYYYNASYFIYCHEGYSYIIYCMGSNNAMSLSSLYAITKNIVSTLHSVHGPTATPSPTPTATPAPTPSPTPAPTNINGMIIDADGVLIDYVGSDLIVIVPDIVKTIGAYAFENCFLVYIGLTENVTMIEEYAFAGSAITSSIIPGSVHTVGASAFKNCKNLQRVEIKEGVDTLGIGAFEGCISLKEVIIPSTVEILMNYLFDGCTSLETVIVPEGVEAIYSYAFNDCSSLRNLVIPESVDYFWDPYGDIIPLRATIFCWSGSNAHLVAAERNFRYVLWDQACNQVMVLPNHLETIQSGAFEGVNVQEVVLPDGCKSIGSRAFTDCDSLLRITIPDSVQAIARDAFSGCPGFLIVAPTGSYASEFARSNGMMTISP